jgi:diadenosine tetraphosphatase ApaH/serine/threonine PP2A family protein phosphatase
VARYLVLTDIHANLEALETCLADAKTRGYEQVLLLGDVVGYGADPNAVIDCVRQLNPTAMVRGNHDKVALGIDQADGFNAAAKAAAQWTIEALTPEHRAWLAALPKGPVVVDDMVEICHGAPFDEDSYIFDELDAMRAIATASRPVCLYGHTHQTIAFELADGDFRVVWPEMSGHTEMRLKPGGKYLVNPGSVGQPRDGDPRASYAIVDTEDQMITFVRLIYDLGVTQDKVIRAGLPEPLARRLESGR